MNTVAWTITLNWNKEIPESFDFDIVESISESWNKTIYFFWETLIKTSVLFLDECKTLLWETINYDISLSSEDHIELTLIDYEEWIYEVASFEWEQINFSEIKKRFIDSPDVISIRECEVSKRFWNKIVRVDFIY